MRRQPRHHLDEQVFLLLGQLFSLSKKLAEKQFVVLDITVSEYSLLRIIENTPRITAGEARKRLVSSAPSVAQLVKSLQRKKMIEREQDAADIRRQKIVLTAKGRKVITKARKAIQSALHSSNVAENVLHSLLKNLTILSSSLSSYGK
ncbi:hypothetical protein A3J34_04760 [Candidatus Peribacteria bacterium RIFCSPLOWO2_02_FULL_51_10]|nr:MAG: hypothetical protein A3J34_04760 [Candidatus Peribacteria bacterium RIFCSPLOWO2_02_FULL_51_10]HLD63702.1 MarR family transcriptional regulator [Candidatus Peribacteraceae bacterium]